MLIIARTTGVQTVVITFDLTKATTTDMCSRRNKRNRTKTAHRTREQLLHDKR